VLGRAEMSLGVTGMLTDERKITAAPAPRAVTETEIMTVRMKVAIATACEIIETGTVISTLSRATVTAEEAAERETRAPRMIRHGGGVASVKPAAMTTGTILGTDRIATTIVAMGGTETAGRGEAMRMGSGAAMPGAVVTETGISTQSPATATEEELGESATADTRMTAAAAGVQVAERATAMVQVTATVTTIGAMAAMVGDIGSARTITTISCRAGGPATPQVLLRCSTTSSLLRNSLRAIGVLLLPPRPHPLPARPLLWCSRNRLRVQRTTCWTLTHAALRQLPRPLCFRVQQMPRPALQGYPQHHTALQGVEPTHLLQALMEATNSQDLKAPWRRQHLSEASWAARHRQHQWQQRQLQQRHHHQEHRCLPRAILRRWTNLVRRRPLGHP